MLVYIDIFFGEINPRIPFIIEVFFVGVGHIMGLLVAAIVAFILWIILGNIVASLFVCDRK